MSFRSGIVKLKYGSAGAVGRQQFFRLTCVWGQWLVTGSVALIRWDKEVKEETHTAQ